ncbi:MULTISPECIES: transketolase family protein [Bradyrhizobium]|uniref:Transketolase n=1 Tax=Bradyrhizobium aeschynomenes TaxID=2734909 RepID=A0ABX2CHH7_9BRAD|nr:MULTISPECIES: transketolase C-terminal domain-containing protein [Bradyrhizobium]NPU67669.1 transketolase [Bradyrhizobium aeschynomenes]NPV22995.1 transketolase [Bradyrhizobium aeschynomenes]CCD99869.1 putative transketolase, C-terminal section (TK) [Bradyrhizobium sp. STM 3809]
MRNAFADELTKLGNEDSRVVMLSGDIGNRLFDKFKDKHPSRFFNCGVAEANMMGVAAGMAMNGLRPVAYTITPFVTTRCLEQIRTDVCYHEAPVTIVAVGAGLAYSGLGPTHHACEDISFLRSIPNMVVICPGDAFEVRGALRAAMQQDRPVYIRMGKKGEPVVHKGPIADFKIGKAITIEEGSDVCLLSTGNMLPEAIEAAHKLKEKGISAEVVSFHTVKPLDEDKLKQAFSRFKLVATIEEHSLIGGFGAAVSEWLVDSETQAKKFLRFGTPDAFFKKSGEQEYAREVLGLTGHQIADKIIHALS